MYKSKQSYIDAIASSAVRAGTKYGYLPSVLIAQSCLENGYGMDPECEILLEHNNMLGMKAELLNASWSDKTVWNGEKFLKDTPEYYGGKPVRIDDYFRSYVSIDQCFEDYCLFMTYGAYQKGGVPKYRDSVIGVRDPEKLISAVSRLGYATDPRYSKSVMAIILQQDLRKYDSMEAQPMPKTKKLEDRKIVDITKANAGQVPRRRTNDPKFIVVHYLGVPNADNPNLYGGGYGGHFNITRDGTIYNAANPKSAVIWHCGGKLQGPGGHSFYQICTNYNSVGIECSVCYTDPTVKSPDSSSDQWYFTEETQESLVWLVSRLMDILNIPIDHVIRHYDVTGKICPNPYVRNNHTKTSWTWKEFKANLAQYRKDGTITIPGGSDPAPERNYLQKGDKGEEVRKMQEMLITCGYDCGSCGADGVFGNDSDKALRAFQSACGLTADGLYGPKSKAILKAEYERKTARPAGSFTVKVLTDSLNIRTGPGMIYPAVGTITDRGIYTIVETDGHWGKLLSGAGWISIKDKYVWKV